MTNKKMIKNIGRCANFYDSAQKKEGWSLVHKLRLFHYVKNQVFFINKPQIKGKLVLFFILKLT